jgi:hypothetical protein
MFSKPIVVSVVVLSSLALPGQHKPATHSSPAGGEVPAVMRQDVAAGKTPVGTRVEAKLAVATLVNGTVIPKDAILSGGVSGSFVSAHGRAHPQKLEPGGPVPRSEITSLPADARA